MGRDGKGLVGMRWDEMGGEEHQGLLVDGEIHCEVGVINLNITQRSCFAGLKLLGKECVYRC